MRRLLLHFADLTLLLFVVVLIFTAERALFYYNFQQNFESFSSSEILNAFFSGFEYDLKVVLIINSPFIFLFFLPVKIYNSTFYLSILKFIYFTSNSFALLFNLLDVNSFAFNGKRISIVNFKDEAIRIGNEFMEFNIIGLIKNYYLFFISFIIIVILLKNLLDFIQRREFENKQLKLTYLIISVLFLSFYTWFTFGFVNDKGEWLERLYTKADRQLAPIVMNNPYLFLASAGNYQNDEVEYWDNVEFQSQKQYDSLTCPPIKHISFIFIETNDSIFNSGFNHQANKQTKELDFNILNFSQTSLIRCLDETLLSVPSVLPTVFCQSVYSLNNFESLAQILEGKSFQTHLFSIGYSKRQVKLLKNFHGFNQFTLLDSMVENEKNIVSSILKDQSNDTSLKTFNLLIINNIDNNISKPVLDLYINQIGNDEMAVVFFIPNRKEQTLKLLPLLKIFLPSNSSLITYENKSIAQLLDIKPTVLNYLNQNTGFIAYGSSLFAKEGKTIFASNGVNSYNLLKDSLFLIYDHKRTKSLFLLKNNSFSTLDFKDSLAIEKIEMENKIHSILMDFEYRIEDNKLK